MSENTKLRVATAIMHVVTFIAVVIAGIAATVALAGCTGSEGGWSSVTFESATVRGTVVLSTPGGPVTIDLSTGIVAGSGEISVESVEVQADVELSEMRVTVASPGSRTDRWVQCVQAIVVTSTGMTWGSPRWCSGD